MLKNLFCHLPLSSTRTGTAFLQCSQKANKGPLSLSNFLPCIEALRIQAGLMGSYTETMVSAFVQCGKSIARSAQHNSDRSERKRFRATFGVSPLVCALAWIRIGNSRPAGARPIHLLWCLFFLKSHTTKTIARIVCVVDEKTSRKWCWIFVNLLADLKVISWDSRYKGSVGNHCLISVDGTDCRIQEPSPFSSRWYSHKFHGPSLRYEVGVCISKGHIVWVNGPFPCGGYSDLKIFQQGMKKALDFGEIVFADGGYQDERCVKVGNQTAVTRFYSVVRARHETVNSRMKRFAVLRNCFRHAPHLHSSCFHAVAKLTQLKIENGEPLFNV